MTAFTDDFFSRIEWLATTESLTLRARRLYMHELLVQICHEGLKDTGQGFGNLFAQVDWLCRHHHVSIPDTIEIQRMRRDTNSSSPSSSSTSSQSGASSADSVPNSKPLSEREMWLYDCRALAVFVSAVFSVDIPSPVVRLIPAHGPQRRQARHIDYRQMRGIVHSVRRHSKPQGERLFVGHITMRMDDSVTLREVNVVQADEYLLSTASEGMTLSVVDVHEEADGSLSPRFIALEPDYLLDISSIARCFTDWGHHPLSYLVNQFQPSANSQAILLGNYAGCLLDNILRSPSDSDISLLWRETLKTHFADEAMAYATCPDFDTQEYKSQCFSQAVNMSQLRQTLDAALLLADGRPAGAVSQSAKPGKNSQGTGTGHEYLLEPSFLCPSLGLQGRVDLMTEDMRLLVEQKSGKNYNIECRRPGKHGAIQQEPHYVQLLLYYAVLHQNFSISPSDVDIRLLYSRYPIVDGLLSVGYYQQLLREAMMVRNRITASMVYFARHGFSDGMLSRLTPETLNERNDRSPFYERYIRPRHSQLLMPLHHCSDLEKSYFCRMATFLFRENAVACLGSQEGVSRSMADIWNMPYDEKVAQGSIMTGRIEVDMDSLTTRDLVLSRSDDSEVDFRIGDYVFIYRYAADKAPDATAAILYKGCLTKLSPTKATLRLADPQPLSRQAVSATTGEPTLWAVEHGYSSSGMTPGLRALYMFMTAEPERRRLLLGTKSPQRDMTRRLTRSYHPSYDEILLQARQARDYYLLIGPPGTGKTSMAMRYMVEEELVVPTAENGSILLTSYTNRAVDEICGMLTDAGIEYLRIGNEFTCAEIFRPRLASRLFAEMANISAIRRYISEVRVVVATTSTLMSRQEILSLKRFSLTIVDEASQILEPAIIGLLSRLGKFILIGDTKQLPAVVQQDERESLVTEPELRAIGLTDCRRSLFERLASLATPDSPYGVLRRQGRMHPLVAAWPGDAFYREERLLPVPLPHQEETRLAYDEPSADDVDEMLKHYRMLFFDVRRDDIAGDVKSNASEARAVASLVVRLRRQIGEVWDSRKTLGVIVPYRNQISLIRREIARLGAADVAESISIDTVERYQGSQRDVIIYSFTVSQRCQVEFLTANRFMAGRDGDAYLVDRKLNVALTRARRQMICVGNMALLSQDDIFRSMIAHCHLASMD
ncbi:MAG: AAA domain-containing protein [Prevotella sp.]